jgi:uncharacterized membrane protein
MSLPRSTSAWRAGWAAALSLIAACGSSAPAGARQEPPSCADSFLTYQNFGAPFIADWCRGCHSSQLPPNMRQGSPLGVNFDDLISVQGANARILARATGDAPTMPPAGGPGTEERALLDEWLRCGAK